MTPLSDSFLDTLASYLEGQRAAGIRELEWEGPLPGESVILPPEPARLRTPAPPPPLEKSASAHELPPTSPPPPVALPTSAGTAWIRAVRHPDCQDSDWPADGWILVVSGRDEFTSEAGTLMNDMLKAIGFIPQDELSDPNKELPAGASRILVFGNEALQEVSPAGMKLQLVRGLWQESPHGRLMATYEPSAVMDSPSGKKAVWSDLQNLMSDLGLEIPEWTRKKLNPRN